MTDDELGGDEVWRGLIRALAEPDRVAVFIDDATLRRVQVPLLPSDCWTWTAVAFAPGAYPAFHNRVRESVRAMVAAGRELHATEIVNPTSRSGWRGFTIADRRAVLQARADELAEGAERMYFLACREHEYRDFVPRVTFSHVPDWVRLNDPANGGWFLALEALSRRLQRDFPTARFVLVSDNAALCDGARSIFGHGTRFYEGSLFHIDSRATVGTQYADLAAYSMQREAHRLQRHSNGQLPGAFDDITGGLVAALKGRRVDVNVVHDLADRAQPAG